MTDERAKDERTEARAAPGSTRFKAIAVLSAVFLLGAVAGGAAGRITALREIRHLTEGPPPEARARFRLEAMRRHLQLRDDQLDRVRTIMAEADAERDGLMEKCGPGLDELRRRTDTRLREVLDEEQRRRFDEMGPRRGRPPGGWPPPPH